MSIRRLQIPVPESLTAFSIHLQIDAWWDYVDLYLMKGMRDLESKGYVLTMGLCFLFIVPRMGISQVNVKIGYSAVNPSFTEADDLLASYAVAGGEVTQSFGNLNFMHGIQLGLRYRFGNTALEAGWESMSRDRSALIYVSANDDFVERVYRYGVNTYSLGFDNYFGQWGVGSSMLSQSFKVDREIGNNDLAILKDRTYQLRFHLIWQVQQTSKVSLYLKPFYQFGLGDYDLTELANDLDVNDFKTNMRPSMFGISIVFYNGKQ